jgi:thymidylate synthase (FAD)
VTEIQFINHAPKVFLVGVSTPFIDGFNEYLRYRGAEWRWSGDDYLGRSEALVEAAGRVCYQSWNNPGNKTREEYIQGSIVEHKHGSVLEHLWVNLLVADLPRSSQLELVRHGDGTAFSFESTRFTNKYIRFVIPPRLRGDEVATNNFRVGCEYAFGIYQDLVKRVASDADEGTLKRKRALEAARSVLPNALGSDGMVSMNARAVRWIVELRTNPAADLSIREFAFNVFEAVQPVLPSILADATVVPSAEGAPEVQFAVSKV